MIGVRSRGSVCVLAILTLALSFAAGRALAQQNLEQLFYGQGNRLQLERALNEALTGRSVLEGTRPSTSWYDSIIKDLGSRSGSESVSVELSNRLKESFERYGVNVIRIDPTSRGQFETDKTDTREIFQGIGQTHPWVSVTTNPDWSDSESVKTFFKRYSTTGKPIVSGKNPTDLGGFHVIFIPSGIAPRGQGSPYAVTLPEYPGEIVVWSPEEAYKFLTEHQFGVREGQIEVIRPATDKDEDETPKGPFFFGNEEGCPYCLSVNPTTRGGSLSQGQKSTASTNHLRYVAGLTGCEIASDTSNFAEFLKIALSECPGLKKKDANNADTNSSYEDADTYWSYETAECGNIVGEKYAANIDNDDGYEDSFIWESRAVVMEYYDKCFSTIDQGPDFAASLRPFVGYLFENRPGPIHWSRCTVTFLESNRAVTSRHCFFSSENQVPLDTLRVHVNGVIYEIEEIDPNPLAGGADFHTPPMGLEDSIVFRIKGELPSSPDWFQRLTPLTEARLQRSQLFYVAYPADITFVVQAEVHTDPEKAQALQPLLPVLEDSVSCRISGISEKGCVLNTCQSMGGASGAVLFAIHGPAEVSIVGIVGGVIRDEDWTTEKYHANTCSFAETTLDNGITLANAYGEVEPPELGYNFSSPVDQYFE